MTEQTFEEAAKSYKIDAGPYAIKPMKSQSHFSRGAWHLLDKGGNIVCICGPDATLWGSKLAYHYAEMARGNG